MERSAHCWRAERNAYWTFLIDTGEGLMVGATPERHVSLSGGVAVMNPISGTLREAPATASRERVVAFLEDAKEREELAMVVDEELKMLAEVGNLGGRVRGPFLKEMANLAHTEYYIEARTTMDPRLILRTTMFAPTATGSPLRNAFRVIKRHERGGRGYYAGVAALIERDAAGAPAMDAPLLLRVAYVGNDGTVRVPVGATLVRGSDPYEEVRETYAKAAGVLRAFGVGSGPGRIGGRDRGRGRRRSERGFDGVLWDGRLAARCRRRSRTAPWSEDPEIAALLASRNESLSSFWLNEHEPADLVDPKLAGRKVLIVDNEDAFTSMLAVELRALGLETTRVAHDEVPDHSEFDLVLLGPGPGDPRDLASPRMRSVRDLAKLLIDHRMPTLGLCLGHEALAAVLGLELVRLPDPDAGHAGGAGPVRQHRARRLLQLLCGSAAGVPGPRHGGAARDQPDGGAARALVHRPAVPPGIGGDDGRTRDSADARSGACSTVEGLTARSVGRPAAPSSIGHASIEHRRVQRTGHRQPDQLSPADYQPPTTTGSEAGPHRRPSKSALARHQCAPTPSPAHISSPLQAAAAHPTRASG